MKANAPISDTGIVTVAEAVILVVLVIFLFLRSWRAVTSTSPTGSSRDR